MNLLCVTLLNNRQDVSRIFLEGMKRLGLEVLAASEFKQDVKLVQSYGHHCLSNHLPSILGTRWNHLITTSLYYHWDYLIISGDDNLYSDEFIESIPTGIGYAGLEKLYMIKPDSKSAMLIKQTHNITIGTGRVLSRKVVESTIVDYRVNVFPEKSRELDHHQDILLLEKTDLPTILDKDKGVWCIDIKHQRNMWPYENFKNVGVDTPYDDALEFLSDTERDMIKQLTP